MAEVIPSINVPTFAGVQERIARVEPFVSWCHLDVTDGVFSKHETWRDPRDLQFLKTKLKAEVHLMIQEPEKIVEQWLVEPIRRVIVHLEVAKEPESIIKKCHAAGIEIGFAINPDTPWEALKPWFGKVDLVLPLGVSPGASGQQADWNLILGKIAAIRQVCPSCIIEADGGVNADTAPTVVRAGADILVAGSAIFDAPDIGMAFQQLRAYISSDKII